MSRATTPAPSVKSSRQSNMRLLADVTDEYLCSALPEQGSITYEDGYKFKGHQDEINMAGWLYCKFGGMICLLKESKEPGARTPDYLWNGRSWELKGATTKNSIDRAIREAAKQIHEKPGGIILDISQSELSAAAIEDSISQRVRRVALDSFDILIISNGILKKILRYKR